MHVIYDFFFKQVITFQQELSLNAAGARTT